MRGRLSDSLRTGKNGHTIETFEETPGVDDAALLDIALGAARQAAALHREAAGTLDPTQWSEKGTSDFVTEVDHEAERRIVERILGRFPTHRVLAEEGTRAAAHAGEILWIIDPLDGTTNWLHGYPEYAVSIAAVDAEGLRLGVVLHSATGEEYVAIRGAGATRDGEPIRVSEVDELRLGLIGTGFPFKRTTLIPDYLRVFEAVLTATSGVRRSGAAAIDLCNVACGRLDAFWEHWLMPWDVAAGALIVREAGGTFGPLVGASEPSLAAATSVAATLTTAFATGDAAVETRTAGEEFPGGAFMAGNGSLDAPFEALVAGALMDSD